MSQVRSEGFLRRRGRVACYRSPPEIVVAVRQSLREREDDPRTFESAPQLRWQKHDLLS